MTTAVNREYEIEVCCFCRKRAEWRQRDRLSWCWQCPNPKHGYKYLGEDQVERIKVVPK